MINHGIITEGVSPSVRADGMVWLKAKYPTRDVEDIQFGHIDMASAYDKGRSDALAATHGFAPAEETGEPGADAGEPRLRFATFAILRRSRISKWLKSRT